MSPKLPLAIFIGTVLQSTLFWHLAPGGNSPDVGLVLTLLFMMGTQELDTSRFLALGSGLLTDIFSLAAFGTNGFLNLLVTMPFSQSWQRFISSNATVQVLTIGAISLVKGLLYYLVLFVYHQYPDFWLCLIHKILPVAGYNMLLATLILQCSTSWITSRRKPGYV